MWLQSPAYTMIHTLKKTHTHIRTQASLRCTSRRHHRRPRRPGPCRSWRCSPPGMCVHMHVHVSAKQASNNPALRHPTTNYPEETHQRLAAVRVRHLLRVCGVLGVLVQALPDEARKAQRDPLAALDLVERALVRGGEGEVCCVWWGGCVVVLVGWSDGRMEGTEWAQYATVQNPYNQHIQTHRTHAPAARTSQTVLGSNQTSTSPMPVL